MIVPDTKNWTWVLVERCPACGFDAGAVTGRDVATLARANAVDWQRLFDAGTIRPGRPNDAVWSSLEYACHVRDVYRRCDGRIALMLDEDDPGFPNWDQDETAVADRYEEQDPAVAVDELVAAAEQVAARLDGVVDEQWARTGRRSDGARFTVDSCARYMVHDTFHHIWDLTVGRDIIAAHQAAIARGDDGYADPATGFFVFTEAYLTAQGTCCGSGCRHCPYHGTT